MPPYHCEKYKQSNPNAECECKDCVAEEQARQEIKELLKGRGSEIG